MAVAQSAHSAGEYRLRDTAFVIGSVLVSRQPLVATRLNDAAVELLAALGGNEFRSPTVVATETGYDVDTVADLCERLHQRGFLAWKPASDPEFQPPVSVVVTVRNDRCHLSTCLDALANLEYPAYEIIVVDDGSTDGTREAAITHELAEQGQLRVVSVGTADEPLGIGASRNQGVDAARHDVVAFTDADCQPTETWLADLVPHLATHDLVGGRVRPAGGDAASAYEGVASSLDMGAYGSRVDPRGDTPYLPTANLLGRREVFEAIPFPGRNVAEDVDVCWRAFTAGYDAVYTPTGIVRHDYRSNLRDLAARRATYGASEALLARDYDHDGTRVRVPFDVLFVSLLVAVAVLSSGVAAKVVLACAALGGGAGLVARFAATVQQYRRVSPVISAGDVARSRVREAISTTYALSREVTRYYAAPIGVLAAGASLVAPTAGLALATGVAVAVGFPLVVEYAVHRPDASFVGYAACYVADHAGYQYGVYRGALAHGTFAHLKLTGRFRLSGPGAGRLTNAGGRSTRSSTARAERNRLQ